MMTANAAMPTNNVHSNNLIDFSDDSRPASTQPPAQSQKSLPTQAGLMDNDDHLDQMNEKMKELKMHEPMKPAGHEELSLKRSDTDSSEIDAFFDAET
jgi:hypothetical protein